MSLGLKWANLCVLCICIAGFAGCSPSQQLQGTWKGTGEWTDQGFTDSWEVTLTIDKNSWVQEEKETQPGYTWTRRIEGRVFASKNDPYNEFDLIVTSYRIDDKERTLENNRIHGIFAVYHSFLSKALVFDWDLEFGDTRPTGLLFPYHLTQEFGK